MKKISILGSTGSIGTQALDIVRAFPEKFKIICLTANKNITLLERQIDEFHPEFVVVTDKGKAEELAGKIDTEVLSGEEYLVNAATSGIDFMINAVVGKSGLMPTLEAIKKGIDIGLANKETLVLAGQIIMKELEKSKSKIIPIDSEHSALFQSLKSGKTDEIKKLILTMGKGPIAEMPEDKLEKVSVNDVVNRPEWDMGMKINVDSATCMNKAFEVVEASWLFGIPPEKIEIIVHPDYICHSLVEFVDGSIITELGTPDMRRYLQYALFYPERAIAKTTSFFDLFGKSLRFENPPYKKFPCLSLGHRVLLEGGTMPAVMHGADTTAVRAFLEKKINFTDIPKIIIQTMEAHKKISDPDIQHILEAENWAEKEAEKIVDQIIEEKTGEIK